MEERGFRPVGLELLGVGVTADADHIITPSEDGPRESIRRALSDAGLDPTEIGTWDLHATATPGDVQEVENLRSVLGGSVCLTARKGTFGHGMSVAGGWELMAQHMGVASGKIFPTPLENREINEHLRDLPFRYVASAGCEAPEGAAGKLSMGVGGINACVISRPWPENPPGDS
jgi:3-oxoacyl-(acyl-carrier-protein) synthase